MEDLPGLQIRVRNWKLFFLFLNQNICCGYSKEPSRWDGSFEHPKLMFKLIDKKTIAILHNLFLHNWSYASAQSDQSLRFPPEETLDTWLPIELQLKTDQAPRL